MVGKANVGNEFFSVADAKQLVSWAKGEKWVVLLSMMDANRDNIYEYAIEFVAFDFL
jgi:hypothetical protein